jgi:hypothetical protein
MSTAVLAPSNLRKVSMIRDSRCHLEQPHRQRQVLATSLSKTAAEDLLDWLEAHGQGDCDVTYVASEGFTITR